MNKLSCTINKLLSSLNLVKNSTLFFRWNHNSGLIILKMKFQEHLKKKLNKLKKMKTNSRKRSLKFNYLPLPNLEHLVFGRMTKRKYFSKHWDFNKWNLEKILLLTGMQFVLILKTKLESRLRSSGQMR